MSHYHVFLGAPTSRELAAHDKNQRYEWHSVTDVLTPPANYTIPPATLEEASRRIFKLYADIDFQDDSEEDVTTGLLEIDDTEHTADHTGLPGKSISITWDPTIDDDTHSARAVNKTEYTFLRSVAASTGRLAETQETQETTGSFGYSDASSIVHFPAFHFSLHNLVSLSIIRERAARPDHHGPLYDSQRDTPTGTKFNILAAVLEMEGPDSIRIKKGPEAGKEVSVLKLIVGDEEGAICRLTAWREVADRWGGAYITDDAVKRGDVVLFQNVKLDTSRSIATSDAPTLTASPTLSSSMQICFRTMPLGDERDSKYRPDLRLGRSDATVRKVSAVVSWFESMAGLPHSEPRLP